MHECIVCIEAQVFSLPLVFCNFMFIRILLGKLGHLASSLYIVDMIFVFSQNCYLSLIHFAM